VKSSLLVSCPKSRLDRAGSTCPPCLLQKHPYSHRLHKIVATALRKFLKLPLAGSLQLLEERQCLYLSCSMIALAGIPSKTASTAAALQHQEMYKVIAAQVSLLTPSGLALMLYQINSKKQHLKVVLTDGHRFQRFH
jgi:hypothetical protein